eukprot:scaffold315_cov354-Pavlova_lutheri.AAC.4
MDRDTKFTSAYWRDFMETLGVTAMLTTSYHQKSDGQTKRQIATLADQLRVALIDTFSADDDWYRCLHIAEFATNNTVQATTGVTPFQAELGRHPTMPFYLLPGPNNLTIDKHVAELCKYRRTIYCLMAINLAKAEERMQYFSNRTRTSKTFSKVKILSCREDVQHAVISMNYSHASGLPKLSAPWAKIIMRSAYRRAAVYTPLCMLTNWKSFGQQALQSFRWLSDLDRQCYRQIRHRNPPTKRRNTLSENTSCATGIQCHPDTMFNGIPLPKNWGGHMKTMH